MTAAFQQRHIYIYTKQAGSLLKGTSLEHSKCRWLIQNMSIDSSKRNVVVVEGVLIPPANETKLKCSEAADMQNGTHCSHEEIEHRCREFSADEITDDFVNEIQGKPVLDNHCQDLVVGHVHSAHFTESKLVTAVVMLYPDTEAGKTAIEKLRSGEYSGFSAFHRFKVYKYANGAHDCVKSPILEVSVCKKGRRNGTYVVRVGKNQIPQQQAISALVKSGEVFASEDMDEINTSGSVEKTIAKNEYNTEEHDVDIKGKTNVLPELANSKSPDLKKIEEKKEMSEVVDAGSNESTVPVQNANPAEIVTNDVPVVEETGDVTVVVEQPADADVVVENVESHTEPTKEREVENIKENTVQENTAAQILQDVKSSMAKQKEENDALRKELENAKKRLDQINNNDQLRMAAEKREEEIKSMKTLESNIESLGYDPTISKSIGSLPKETVTQMNDFVSHMVKQKSGWMAENKELDQVKNKYKQVKAELESLHSMLGPQANSSVPKTCSQEKRNFQDLEIKRQYEQTGECAMSLHPSKKPKLSEEDTLQNMYKNKEIDWNQWMDMRGDLMKSEHVASITSGSMAASADGGFVSDGYNRDLDVVAQTDSRCSGMTLASDAMQLCGPSLRHHNKAEFDKILNNLRSIDKMTSTQIGEMNMADMKRSSFINNF